jgi:SAM-dependent methyltransferase
MRADARAPQPAGPVLVPGCGRGHEAALLVDLGHPVVALDFSVEAIQRGQQRHESVGPRLRWLAADLFDAAALDAAGLGTGGLSGVLEHTCFCAIDPDRRAAYLETVVRLLAPGGWLLGLFWCHQRPGGPPWGSDPELLGQQVAAAGLRQQLWEPARGSVPERENEWLGLWSR